MYDFSDSGNAELFIEKFGKSTRFDPKTERWLSWKSRHQWFELDKTEILSMAIEAVNERFEMAKESSDKTFAGKQASFAVRSRNYANLQAMLKTASQMNPVGSNHIQWDAQPNLLSVGNGVINLATGKLRQGQPNDYLTRGLSIPYMPEAKAPRWEKFISEIMCGRTDLVEFLQRAVGYTLTGFTSAQAFFLLYGEGSNGKSVFTEILSELLTGFSRTVRFSAFDERNTSDARRDLAELPGIRAVFASEGGRFTTMDTSIIKEITGGTVISTARKYGHPFEFKPQFKLWMATNHLPKVEDDSLGFWRRIIVIPFDATFVGRERDDNLRGKLTEELPGILTWAVKGASDWSKKGLQIPDSLLLRVNEYKEDQDTISGFLNDSCSFLDVESVRANVLYEGYKLWCAENGFRPLTNAMFGRKVAKRFKKEHDRNGWYYTGITLKFEV